MNQSVVASGWSRNLLLLSSLGLSMSVLRCECNSDGPGLSRLSAEIDVMPADLQFGEVPLGARKELPVTVENRGSDVLRICLSNTTLPACIDKTSLDPMNAPFAPRFENPDSDHGGAWIVEKGAKRDFIVSFSPQASGPVSATLTIVHNAVNGPTTTVTMSGTGVAPQVDFSADMLDFGQVTVGMRKTLDLVLTNRTQFAQPVTIPAPMQAAVIFGTSNDQGVDMSPYQGEVPGNGALTIKVWYQPPEEGQHMNTLNVTYCPTCMKDIAVTGQGVKPLFQLDPGLLDFGTTNEGQTGVQQFVVRNIGNVALTVNNVALEAGTTNEFAVAPQAPLPAILNPSETLTVAVTYVGVTPGYDEGRVQVDTNAWDDPNTTSNDSTGFVKLQATSIGPDIDPLPPAINFGTVAIGGNAVTRNLILQNAGNAPLTITNIVLNTPTPEISIRTLPGLPATIDPANSIQVVLQYAPADAGLDEAEVVVTSNDPDEGNLSVHVAGIGGVPTTCSITVAPSQVTFGLVERGRRATLPVEVRNSGAQPCTVSQMLLNGGAEFTLPTMPPAAVNIPAGSSFRVDVDYSPTSYGMHSTQLQFNSDDPAQPMVSVPISGASAPSDLLVVPSALDFNVVPVTCRSPNRAVTLYNTGSNTITITQVYLDPSTSPEFELTPYSTPTSIPAGGSSVLNLRYHPVDIGADNGVLFVVHSAAAVPVAVPLSGEGQVNPTVTDTFNQLPTPQADVLFVVDNSGSMAEEQAALGSNLGSFVSFAQMQNIEFHIGVTTTDIDFGGEAGRLVGPGKNPNVPASQKILTPTTPNVNALFNQIVTDLGTFGSSTEVGFEPAYLALTDPLLNNENAGFLRNDAALAIIFVSDTDDQSSRPESFYEMFFRNIKGFQNSSLFSASAVVNYTGLCPDAESTETRYSQLVQATGGVLESICAANWGQTLANIGLNTFGLKRSFTLSSEPVPVTIAVTVDGAMVPSVTAGGHVNWTYDSSTNSVVFDQSDVPQANAVITVTYSVACLP